MYRKPCKEALDAPDKQCNKCGEVKLKTEFPVVRANKDGCAGHCKACNRIKMQAWFEANPNAKRADALKRLYGITLEDYDNILKEQDGGCAICGKKQGVEKKSLAVDHAHKGPNAGTIRGLLCHRCNKWLVGRHVSGDLLRKAGEYLETADTGFKVPEKYINGRPKKRKRRK